jgi:hypothetical protein
MSATAARPIALAANGRCSLRPKARQEVVGHAPPALHESRTHRAAFWTNVGLTESSGLASLRRAVQLIRLSNQQATEDDVNRRLTAAATVAVAAAMALPGTVYAAGQVEQGNGRSICHFSGLNDDPGAQFPDGGRVQSYGQLVRQGLKEFLPSPGVACNPTSGFGE